MNVSESIIICAIHNVMIDARFDLRCVLQHDQRAHRPGELGAGAGGQRARRGALLRARQVDGAARVPAPRARQQDGVAPPPQPATHTCAAITHRICKPIRTIPLPVPCGWDLILVSFFFTDRRPAVAQ